MKKQLEVILYIMIFKITIKVGGGGGGKDEKNEEAKG